MLCGRLRPSCARGDAARHAGCSDGRYGAAKTRKDSAENACAATLFMSIQAPAQLASDRLLLRRFRASDTGLVFAALASDRKHVAEISATALLDEVRAKLEIERV